MQRSQQKTQLYSRGGKEGEKEKRTATASISVPSGGVRLREPTTQPTITQKTLLLHTKQRLAHAQQCLQVPNLYKLTHGKGTPVHDEKSLVCCKPAKQGSTYMERAPTLAAG